MKTINFVQEELINLASKQENRSPELLLICGSLDFKVMSNMIGVITSKLELLKTSNTFITKTKLLSTEIIQNVFKHGYSKGISNSYFAIYFDNVENHIILKTGNLVEAEKSEKLKSKLEHYKSLSATEVKTYFMGLLKTAEVNAEDNAGLGLISLFHRSKGLINYNFIPVDQQLNYFVIEVKYQIN